jgi:hypothetical protein
MEMNEDALAKLGLQALLSPFVTVLSQHEVQAPTQFVDLFVPAPPEDPTAAETALGLLGRMVAAPAQLEAFSDTVTLHEGRDCLRKQLTLHHALILGAPRGTSVATIPLPQLWILSLGRPRALLGGWGMTAAAGWPSGVYRTAEGLGAWVVVLRELPRTRETLLVRLFGDDEMLVGVSFDLLGLGAQDPVRQASARLLYRWRVWLKGHPEDEATRRRLMNFEQMVEQETQRLIEFGKADGLREGKAEGLREGLHEGTVALREAVGDLCELLGVELTEARRQHLASLDLAGLQQLRVALKATRSWPAGG